MASHEPEVDPVAVLTGEVRQLRKALVAISVALVALLAAIVGLVVWNLTQESRLTGFGDYVIGKGDQRDAENAARQEELRLLACRLLAGTATWGDGYYDSLREEYGCLPQPASPSSPAASGSPSPTTTPATNPSSTSSSTSMGPGVPATSSPTRPTGAPSQTTPPANPTGSVAPTVQPTSTSAGSVPPAAPSTSNPTQVCVLQLVCLPL